jgi:hypothetical protein
MSSTHLGPKTRILFLSDICGFVDVWRCLTRGRVHRPTQPPIQWRAEMFPENVAEGWSKSSSNAEIKNGGAIPPLPHKSPRHGVLLIEPGSNFTLVNANCQSDECIYSYTRFVSCVSTPVAAYGQDIGDSIPNKRRVYPLLHRRVQTGFEALRTFFSRVPQEPSSGVKWLNVKLTSYLYPVSMIRLHGASSP